jgi:3D (Asp-Asp-Asp) domain-containing protein
LLYSFESKYGDTREKERRIIKYILSAIIIFSIIYITNFTIKILDKKDYEIQSLKTQNLEYQNIQNQMSEIILDREGEIEQLISINKELNQKNDAIENIIKSINKFDKNFDDTQIFRITGYDLGFSSRGETKLGYNLIGQSLNSARIIATDPSVVPTGSIVYLYFIDKKYMKYNGLYICGDTGGAVKGYVIDLFFGDRGYKGEESPEVNNFGVQYAKVIKIK